MMNVCKICGKEFKDKRRRNGCCPNHSFEIMKQSIEQMQQKSGPYYDKWRAGMKIMAKEL